MQRALEHLELVAAAEEQDDQAAVQQGAQGERHARGRGHRVGAPDRPRQGRVVEVERARPAPARRGTGRRCGRRRPCRAGSASNGRGMSRRRGVDRGLGGFGRGGRGLQRHEAGRGGAVLQQVWRGAGARWLSGSSGGSQRSSEPVTRTRSQARSRPRQRARRAAPGVVPPEQTRLASPRAAARPSRQARRSRGRRSVGDQRRLVVATAQLRGHLFVPAVAVALGQREGARRAPGCRRCRAVGAMPCLVQPASMPSTQAQAASTSSRRTNRVGSPFSAVQQQPLVGDAPARRLVLEGVARG